MKQFIIVAAAIIEKEDRVLIARRAYGKHLGGFWEFPGGKLEEGETPQKCLERELLEELNIKVEVLDFVGESFYQYPGKLIRLMGFRAKYKSGTIILKDHDQIKWVTLDQISDYNLAPADIPIIKILKQ